MFQIIAITAIVAMFALMAMARMGAGAKACCAGKPVLLGRLSVCALAVSVLALVATGIGGPLLNHGGPLSGFLLLGHTSCAALFIAGLAGSSIFCAERLRFGADNPGGKARKAFFWLMLPLGLVTILSVLVSMTPVFDTHGLELMFQVHRWSALAMAMSLIGFVMSR